MGTWADSAYKYRIPISVPVFTVGGGGATNVDIQLQIPPDWDLFWGAIRSDFFDIEVYTANGESSINYQRQSGASYSGRNLTLEIEQAAIDDQSSTSMFWLYFGDPDQATDPTTAFTVSSPKTGYVWIGRPVNVVKNVIAQAGRSVPEVTFTKEVAAAFDIWFDLRPLFAAYIDPYNNRLSFETIKRVEPKSLDSSGTDSDARYAQDDMYFIAGYANIRIKGGSSGTDYSVGLNIHTTNNQVFTVRALLKVQNLLPV
jgi:hypothetical protein